MFNMPMMPKNSNFTFEIHLKLLISFDFSWVNKKSTKVHDKYSKTDDAYKTDKSDLKK